MHLHPSVSTVMEKSWMPGPCLLVDLEQCHFSSLSAEFIYPHRATALSVAVGFSLVMAFLVVQMYDSSTLLDYAALHHEGFPNDEALESASAPGPTTSSYLCGFELFNLCEPLSLFYLPHTPSY